MRPELLALGHGSAVALLVVCVGLAVLLGLGLGDVAGLRTLPPGSPGRRALRWAGERPAVLVAAVAGAALWVWLLLR